MTTPTVLFDVDGTLLDTNYFHVVAWWRACRERGADASMAWLHRQVGKGSDKLIEDLVGHPDQALNEAHSRHYQAFWEEIRPFPEAAGLLRDVAKTAGVWLATSAKPEELERMLDALNAGDAIRGVVSSGEVEHSKPDPDIFARALARAGADPRAAIVVGDTVWDVAAARSAGLDCVCVESGGISRVDLEAAGAVAVYADVGELRRSLSTSPLARSGRARSGAG